MARPKKNLCKPTFTRLAPEEHEAVRQIAEQDRRDISEVVRLAVIDYVAAWRRARKRRAAA